MNTIQVESEALAPYDAKFNDTIDESIARCHHKLTVLEWLTRDWSESDCVKYGHDWEIDESEKFWFCTRENCNQRQEYP